MKDTIPLSDVYNVITHTARTESREFLVAINDPSWTFSGEIASLFREFRREGNIDAITPTEAIDLAIHSVIDMNTNCDATNYDAIVFVNAVKSDLELLKLQIDDAIKGLEAAFPQGR